MKPHKTSVTDGVDIHNGPDFSLRTQGQRESESESLFVFICALHLTGDQSRVQFTFHPNHLE